MYIDVIGGMFLCYLYVLAPAGNVRIDPVIKECSCANPSLSVGGI